MLPRMEKRFFTIMKKHYKCSISTDVIQYANWTKRKVKDLTQGLSIKLDQ